MFFNIITDFPGNNLRLKKSDILCTFEICCSSIELKAWALSEVCAPLNNIAVLYLLHIDNIWCKFDEHVYVPPG